VTGPELNRDGLPTGSAHHVPLARQQGRTHDDDDDDRAHQYDIDGVHS
jgi:hypothetical protein